MTVMTKPPVMERTYLALSHAQRGVWLDMRLIEDPAAYQVGCLVEFEGEVDPDLARQAVRIMMARHDALRLRVDPHEPRQWVEQAGSPPFQVIDFSQETDPEQSVRDHVRTVQAQGFQLGEGPLFRVDLLRLGEDRSKLLMIAHHLIADGVSIRLAQAYWLTAYKSLTGELDDDDADETGMGQDMPRSSYAPVVKDDEAYAASERYQQDLAYWSERLRPLPQLLFDNRPPGSVTGSARHVAPLLCDAPMHAALASVARKANTTLHRALVAIIGLALSRRYRSSDFTIGMALHRRDAATRHVIGMLAGLVALRVKPDQDLSLMAAVERVAAGFDADLRHQRLPIDAIGRSLAAKGAFAERPGRNLFDVVVTVLPAASETPVLLAGKPMRSLPLRDHETTPLAIYVDERPDHAGMSIGFGFNPQILGSQEVERLRDQLSEILKAFAAGSDERLSSFDGLSSLEREQISRWSAGSVRPVPEGTLAELFEAVATRQPDACAVVCGENEISYAQLDRAANRVAARLQDRGLRPGTAVGVCLERSMGSVVAILGILKAGLVYLPLDPVYPAERLADMIADAGAVTVITREPFVQKLPAGTSLLTFDEVWPLAGEDRTIVPPADVTAESRAYIIYTSGSTGRPKGVVVSHRALINLAFARQEHDPIGPGDRVLAAISIGFDVSLGQLLTPLLAGASIVVAGDIRGISGAAFWEFITRHRVTHVNSVPSFFESVLDQAPARTDLKQIMLGGEPLSGHLAETLRHRLSVSVYNMYGPTEACIDATAFRAPESGVERVAVLPIGRPLPNYTVHILDEALRPVSIGAEGELYIGGPSLAEGYVNRPDLTLERFVEHRVLGRLYRTGDRVFWREDGNIAFLGRNDSQVKIRGFRIELGEIEAVLRDHPDVAQAAVIVRRHGEGEPRILGYVVGKADSAAISTDDLRAFLARRLPGHMVPSGLMSLPHLPLSTNGKLDEKGLPDPGLVTLAGEAPRTATEVLLSESFVSLLGIPHADTQSHFFELGGHSLLATQLASRLREALGVELPIRLLFEAPRLGELAARIDTLIAQGDGRASDGLVPQSRPSAVPLSFEQEGLWFLYKLDPQSPAYNIPIVLKLDGDLCTRALSEALTAVVARHESLRTIFIEVDGEPQQRILETFGLALDVENLEGADPSFLFAKAAEEARRPFSLEQDLLIRARLLRLSSTTHIVLITMHHIVSDGWSTGILLREVLEHYAASTANRHLDWDPLPVQYADYALWQREHLTDTEIARQVSFWQEALHGAPQTLALPVDHMRPAIRSDLGGSESIALDKDLMGRLADFARAHQATPFIVLSAAWSVLLARWTGQDDLVIGAPIANRGRREIEGLIGFFVNTIPLRADLSGQPTFSAVVERMRTMALNAYAHADLPFEKLVEALKPERGHGQHPIFQTMVAFQPGLPAPQDLAGLTVSPVPLPETAAKFDLTLVIQESAGGYAGGITYARDLFRSETIARLAEEFTSLLSAAIATPSCPISILPMTSKAAEARLAAFASPSSRPVVVDTIGRLFEQQVERLPGHEAVAFGDRRLSFDELNRRVNRLAHRLIALGVGPERPVGVVLARSEALVVAALAIMKAGGVYTPVDPAHPADRMATIFAKAKPVVVLVDGSTEQKLPANADLLRLDHFDFEDGPDHNPEVMPGSSPTPENLAYIIHTSGSTGQPKGVGVSHAALVHLAEARMGHDPIGAGDRVLASLSVSFDVSVGQLVTPLLKGATVVVSGHVAAMTPAEFWDLMREERITHLNSGPAFLDAVLDSVPEGLSLRRLMLGGEPFPTVLAAKIQAALPEVELFNMYGPTEACIDATCHRFTGRETGATLPIGRPLPNYRLMILDVAMQPLPVGMPGEIFIGGPTLARGYLGLEQETRDRFVVHPLSGERLYRTGDLGRWNDAGEIEFLGRADGQVKIRGYRIELDEIAAILRAHPLVRSAAATTYPREGQTVLIAYVVMEDGTIPVSLADWHSHLGAQLPAYMLPAAVVSVPALPMTVNGKLDLKALPAPDFTDGQEIVFAPPRDELDQTLIGIWRDLLTPPEAGIDENFFKAGGHSLLALRFVAACKAKLNVEAPISALYQHQTIRAFADAIRSGHVAASRGPLVVLGQGEGRPVFGFHPVGGGAFGYLGLAQALAGRRPVYGIQARGLEAGEEPVATIEEMASEYLAAIRTVQPKGPYSFIGHSFGGMMAFEITRRLEAEGETVDRLVMLDTSLVGQPWTIENATETAQTIIGLERMRSKKLNETIEPAQVQRIIKLVANNMRLCETYVPTRIATPMMYVLAKRGLLPDDGRREFWCALTQTALDHPPLDCDHYAVLNADNIARLAGLFVEGDYTCP